MLLQASLTRGCLSPSARSNPDTFVLSFPVSSPLCLRSLPPSFFNLMAGSPNNASSLLRWHFSALLSFCFCPAFPLTLQEKASVSVCVCVGAGQAGDTLPEKPVHMLAPPIPDVMSHSLTYYLTNNFDECRCDSCAENMTHVLQLWKKKKVKGGENLLHKQKR